VVGSSPTDVAFKHDIAFLDLGVRNGLTDSNASVWGWYGGLNPDLSVYFDHVRPITRSDRWRTMLRSADEQQRGLCSR
jgi:hypothetical protein